MGEILLSQSSPHQPGQQYIIGAVEVKGETYVARLSRDAFRAGLQLGMKLAHAQALFPEAVVCEFDLSAEETSLKSLACSAYSISSICSIDEPPSGIDKLFNHRYTGINIEVSGSRRIFEGYENLLQIVDRHLAAQGIFARLCIAPGLGAAWACSRFLPKRSSIVTARELKTLIQPLPLAALRLQEQVATGLKQVNVRTLGQLLQIPRRSLVARFGGDVVRRIDQLLGVEEEVLTPEVPSRLLRESCEFVPAVAEVDTLLTVAGDMLTRLCATLRSRGKALVRFHLLLLRDGGVALNKDFEFLFSSIPEEHIRQRLQLYLEKIDFAQGIKGMKITILNSERENAREISLFDVDRIGDEQEKQTLLERLQERWGKEKVLEVCYRDSFLPENAFLYAAYRGGKTPAVDTSSCQPVERPSLLFPCPESISALAVVPDQPPFQIKWRNRNWRVLQGEGPERIASEWWKNKGLAVSTRDYFKLQVSSGLWVWVYRELESQSWFIHGLWV